MILDFANTLRAAVAPGMSRVEGVKVDLKNRVEHDGDNLLAEITNRNFEVVTLVLENLGSQFKRRVNLHVPIVGLHQR